MRRGAREKNGTDQNRQFHGASIKQLPESGERFFAIRVCNSKPRKSPKQKQGE
jgi:hypothetical protein